MDTPLGKIIVIGIMAAFLAAMIALGANMFSTSKSSANDGVVDVQGQLGELQKAKFTDFDQKTVTGSQVTSAYTQMNGSPVGVIVKTCQGDWVNYNAIISPFSGTTSKQTTIPYSDVTRDASTKQISTSVSYLTKTSADADISLILSAAADPDQRTVLYNSVTTDMYKNGSKNYVSSTSKFSSYLIRDAGDNIVGIVFIQQGKHT